MENADSGPFDIVFAGECLDGHEVPAVRAALAKLFRADDATLARLFSGTPQRIKSAVDAETAQKYAKAMAAAGARAILRPVSAELSPAEAPDTQDSPATAMTLAPPGSDVLRPEERTVPSGKVPATDHLSIAQPGERLSEEKPVVADPHPQADFDVAAAGSDLSDGVDREAPPPPDTSGISLHEGELDLSDCATAPAGAPSLDLDHLSVADAGKDLLAESERKRDETQAPDTSHLSVSDPEDP
jgi:hypothetical protein